MDSLRRPNKSGREGVKVMGVGEVNGVDGVGEIGGMACVLFR